MTRAIGIFQISSLGPLPDLHFLPFVILLFFFNGFPIFAPLANRGACRQAWSPRLLNHPQNPSKRKFQRSKPLQWTMRAIFL